MDKSLISCWTIFFYTQPEAEGFTVDHYRWVTAATVSFCPTAQMASAGTLWTNHHLALLIYSTGYYRFAGGCRNRTAYTWIIKDDKKNSVKGNPNLRLRFCFSLKVKLIAVALENGAIKHSYWTFTADLVSELIAICIWPKQMSAFGKLIHVFVQNIQIKEAVHPQIKKKTMYSHSCRSKAFCWTRKQMFGRTFTLLISNETECQWMLSSFKYDKK